jgi:hypothetical protein
MSTILNAEEKKDQYKTLYNIHIFDLPILCHISKRLNFHQTMDEGIAYIGPIVMW